MVDGKYRFSLGVAQISSLSIKIGREYTEKELANLQIESEFGKLYGRALEYCLMRPHSSKEVRDYLYRKTLNRKVKDRRTGEVKDRPGVSRDVTDRVYERLESRGYVDDEKFARFWIENRNIRKGTSRRKLQSELIAKGVPRSTIEKYLNESERSDTDELRKAIIKKKARYTDEKKLIQYLVRQGFNYDDVISVLSQDNES